MQRRRHQLMVVVHAPFDRRSQRRIDQLRMDALLIEQLQARRTVAELRLGSSGSPLSSRSESPSVFLPRYHNSWLPGAATTSNVGLGIYSMIWPPIAILVRPLT